MSAFQIALDRQRHAPGETVSGVVTVTEPLKSRKIEVFLNYREETDDYKEIGRSVGSGPLHEGRAEAGQTLRFSIQLPPDALPAHQSANGGLYWEVDVKSDELGMDTHGRFGLDVQPARLMA